MTANLPFYSDSTIVRYQLNKLSSRSIRYSNMYSVSEVGASSCSAIITGMYLISIRTQHIRTGSGVCAWLVHFETGGSVSARYESFPGTKAARYGYKESPEASLAASEKLSTM